MLSDRTKNRVFIALTDKTAADELIAEVDSTDSLVRSGLTIGAEAVNAITITGQIRDLLGNAVTGVRQVVVRSLAVTADQGDLAVTAGTSKKVVNPTTGENVAWLETTAAGAFAFSVTNTAAEDTVVQVFPENGIPTVVKLTFAP